MSNGRPIDWLLLTRYAVLVALTELVPVPLLDRGLENVLRRRLVRALLARHGVTLDDAAIRMLADEPGGGCLGCLAAIVLWPIKKLLKSVVFVFQAKAMADKVSDVVHRSLLLEEALESGWLPGDAENVRAAMDRSLEKVDVRVVERAVLGTFRDRQNDWSRLIAETTRVARERARSRDEGGHALADAADRDDLGDAANELSSAMSAALQATGISAEVVQWFRAEMGAPPKLERRVAGAVEPTELLPGDADGDVPRLAPPPIEEAVEVAAPETKKPEGSD